MSAINLRKTVLAGITATASMSALMLMAPMMGFPPMNIGAMLGKVMGGSLFLGWMGHFVIGIALAVAYASFCINHLPGRPALRGMLFSLLPFFMAQLIVMPMMGAGLFGGSVLAALGSLLGHLVYGAVLGVVYCVPSCSTQCATGSCA